MELGRGSEPSKHVTAGLCQPLFSQAALCGDRGQAVKFSALTLALRASCHCPVRQNCFASEPWLEPSDNKAPLLLSPCEHITHDLHDLSYVQYLLS